MPKRQADYLSILRRLQDFNETARAFTTFGFLFFQPLRDTGIPD